jgi:CheY-like chemotaxis protein
MGQPKSHILVVDDEEDIRLTMQMLLRDAGYEVSTAVDGFDALAQLRTLNPLVIISDLNMPHMSGFEFLSVVRRRFPDIPVIAISGAYKSRRHVPGGVIADAFYPKGAHRPAELLRTVTGLIRTRSERVKSHHLQPAPVWIPRNGKDSNGVPFIVLTCTECLRSFSLSVPREDVQEIQQTPCRYCSHAVRYIIDFSVGVSSPRPPSRAAIEAAQRSRAPTGQGASLPRRDLS